MAKKGKKNAPKKKVNGYKMPPPIPLGEIIHHGNKEWKIGPSIGVGGFGEIYSACEYKHDESSPRDVVDYPYVLKIEPEQNGPLFVEMHFYNRNCHRNDIEEFMRSRSLSQLGMPTYIGAGIQMIQDESLRFLIVERYGTDLWKIFNQVGKKFPAPTVFQLGLQMLDVLDYIHSRSYIHADIKGANILLGIEDKNQAYLLDFGLAYRIVDDNFMPDLKSAHEGTIEYTSTDRHVGAKTMRGDLEILGFNLLHWLVGKLPWEDVLEDPNKVHKKKKDFMNNVRIRMTTDYPDVPDELIQFFEYIKTLELGDQPDYAICCPIFERYLASVGKTRRSQLEFPIITARDSQSEPDENQEQIVKKNNIFKAREDDTPEIVPTSEGNSVGEVVDNKEEVKKDKKTKAIKDKSPEVESLTDSVNEPLDINQEQGVTKPKKNKKYKNKALEDMLQAKKDVESVKPDANQEEKVIKINKTKKQRHQISEDTPAENDAENEPDDNQEQIVTKVKKNKNKEDKDPDDRLPVENDVENEEPCDQRNKATKNKKNKKQKDINLDVTLENDTESKQLDEHQQHKVKKNKKQRGRVSEDTPLVEENDEIEQPGDYQEEEVPKNKRKRDKSLGDKSPNVNDAESEQLHGEQDEKVTKSKKAKKQKGKEPEDMPADNGDENELAGDHQEEKVVKNKRNKRKRDKSLGDTPPIVNDAESEQLNDEQDEKVTKSKKATNQKGKKPEDVPADNGDEYEQTDDDQEEKVAKNKKNKRKGGKKSQTTPAEDTGNDQIDDNEEQEVTTEEPERRKRKRNKKTEVAIEAESDYDFRLAKKNKKQTTPKKKKKTKAKSWESDDESEIRNKKTPKRERYRMKADDNPQYNHSLPLKEVEADTGVSERKLGLRSEGKKIRPNYKMS